MLRPLLPLMLFLALAGAACADPAPPPVRIDSGALQGVLSDGVVSYKGIPFAAPPVGPLRWRPPQPPAPWTGVRDASSFGPICPQSGNFGTPAGAVQSEDCLTLNVWTPAAPPPRPAPVMVWIHGGGDDSGTAHQPQFDGASFARDGIVFVSVDYRLGALGWFAHPALTREAGAGAPLANYGLMDEIAALQWVKRNIAAFGGDPAQVTVAGESAGGEAVLFLLTTPAARGLFARAIVESGSGWQGYPDLAKAEAEGADLANRAGGPAGATADQLRALPVSALVSAAQGAGPVVDGRLIHAGLISAFQRGLTAPVPLLIGSNSGEDSLLGGGDPKDVLKGFTSDQLAALRRAYGAEAADDATLGRDIFRDQWMGAPMHWFAGQQSAKAPTWLYQFAVVPGVLQLRRTRASHGFEMLYVFDAFARAPRPLPEGAADTAEIQLIHGCWVSFVKTGAPACPGGPNWPAVSPKSDSLMLFADDGNSIQTGFRRDAYDILDGIELEGPKAGDGR